MSVEFELKADYSRVVVNVQGSDEPYVIESGSHKVTDPELIAALDASPGVKRSDGTPPPPIAIVESADRVVQAEEPKRPAKPATSSSSSSTSASAGDAAKDEPKGGKQ